MIDTKRYDIIDNNGYPNREEAYEVAKIYSGYMNGITTYRDNGLWYIVQSKILANM